MTMPLLLLAFVAVAGAGLAVSLWRLFNPRQAGSMPAGLGEILAATRSPLETYQPLSRLFAEEDFTFLAAERGAPPGAAKLLRRSRCTVLRLYLRQMRAEFRQLHLLCRVLAPQAADPDFATRVARQALAFHGLMLVLEVRCALGWVLPVRVDAGKLVAALDQLRQAARASLAVPTPQLIAS